MTCSYESELNKMAHHLLKQPANTVTGPRQPHRSLPEALCVISYE
jgi:hypothetical protein